MDLNMLDACVYHFIEGLAPDLSGRSECSLVNNLSQMLDQDGNRAFNIYDVDLCVRAFLNEEPCDDATQTCPDDQVYCESDSECGAGLFCDTDLKKCSRECGLIVDRGGQGGGDSTLDRKCAGRLRTCDYDTGRCIQADLSAALCQVDQECPSGSYCFLGKCEAKCYRSLDCPGSEWLCTRQNECAPRPRPSSEPAPFNPKDYSVQMATSEVLLDPVRHSYEIPLLLMDLVTKAQVFDQPNAVFGYRLQLSDYKRMDEKCRQDVSRLTPAQRLALQQECVIGPDREFITLGNPFGTIYGTGDPTLLVGVNAGIAGRLSPGSYQVTLTAVFSNGGRTSATIRYKHPSPSGEYVGGVTIYADNAGTPLGSTPLGVRLYIDPSDSSQVAWDDLLAENNIAVDRDIEDRTRGYRVRGFIHGSSSMMFNWPGAAREAENEIPVKGIFVPRSRRLRLIGLVDYAANFCRSENGLCNPSDPNELKVTNVFGRRVRRTMEFFGDFDAETNRYAGTYRDTYVGLAPSTVTLDGSFALNQTVQDETPIQLGALAANPQGVGFPGLSSMLSSLESEIQQYCPASIRTQFHGTGNEGSQASAFRSYMRHFDSDGGPIFAELQRFESRIQEALGNLGSSSAAFSIDQFLKGSILFCDSAAGVTSNCIRKADLTCGLALYRKAILRGWVDLGALGGQSGDAECSEDDDCEVGEACLAGTCYQTCEGPDLQRDPDQCAATAACSSLGGRFVCTSSGEATLFCKDIPGRRIPGELSDCPTKAIRNPPLVALQDHNRFYRELVQTHAYEAGAAARSAFLLMYHAANGDPMDESSAYAQKLAYLRKAMTEFDRAQAVNFSAPSSQVLFQWPMDSFATKGLVWLKQMHVTSSDRMEALLELVDHRRRVLRSASQEDYLFAHHVMHQEYLQQVFLVALQRRWEKATFAYAGNAQDVITLGQQLLAKASDNRNPLGLHPSRIYFENADLVSSNWQNFRRRLNEELPRLETNVQEALANMRGALNDQNSFLASLRTQSHQLSATIEEYCGSSQPLPANCDIPFEEKKIEMECQGPGCLMEFTCDDPACSRVVKSFNGGAAAASEVACRADSATYKIRVGGSSRLCVRGRVGALMQERAALDLQRRQIANRVQNLVRQIARHQQFIADTQSQNAELNGFLFETQREMRELEGDLMAANAVFETVDIAAHALECTIGLATDCVGKAAAGVIRAQAALMRQAVTGSIQMARTSVLDTKELFLNRDSQDRNLMSMRMQLDNLVTDVENHIASYEAVVQQLFNLNMRIEDTLFLAQQAANRNVELTGDLVERLVGSESGSVLAANARVQEANARFQKMLVEAYKMTRAFVHRYNLDSQAEAWSNRVYQIVTIQDLKQFISFLDNVEQNYCGAQGLDCDYINNGEVFEFSVQKQLFPDLRDIVDPNTGKVLTAGQQFHNLITSSAYRKRRARPYGLVEQIEIPFAIWLNDRGESGGAPQRYMVGPGDCNHIIRGDGPSGGTVAVNVLGTRIPRTPGVKYELWRGNTDYIRSCTEKVSRYESKINTYIVGWTPTSALGQLDNPPSFFSQSGELGACINNQLLANPATVDSQTGCFRYFARDRSLGAPDYQLVIPQLDRDQSWLLGDGLPGNEKPVIEDIVLYFRYNDRPITAN
jgi:hypothetical protein